MTDIGFYHLTRSKLQDALPKLLGRVLDTGGRGFIRCADAERARTLDAALWLPADPPWLPHGLVGGEHDAAQPLLIADQDVPPALQQLRAMPKRQSQSSHSGSSLAR